MTTNQFNEQIIRYRNAKDKLIVIYDDDESIAPNVAQSFAERDIENVWLLSGGMNLFRQKFPMLVVNATSPQFDPLRLQNAIFEATPAPTISDTASIRTMASRHGSSSRNLIRRSK